MCRRTPQNNVQTLINSFTGQLYRTTLQNVTQQYKYKKHFYGTTLQNKFTKQIIQEIYNCGITEKRQLCKLHK